MDQIIEKFGIDWKIFTAEIVNFLILLAILSYFFYKKIFSVIDERQKVIDDGLKKSEEAGEILEDAKDQKKDILAEARNEASEKINKAIELGQEKKDGIIVKAKKESDRIIANARKSGEEQKENIVKSSKEEISKMIVLGAEKVLAEK